MRSMRGVIGTVQKTEPSLAIWMLLSCLVTGAAPLLGIMIPRFLLDELMGAQDKKRLFFLVGVLAVGTFLCAAGKAVCKKKTTVLLEDCIMKMEEQMGKIPSKIPLSVSESKSSMDLYERGKYGINAFRDFFENVQKIGGAAITLASAGGIILANRWYLLLLLLAANLFAIPCIRQIKKLEVDNARRSVPEDREFQYYCMIANDFRYAKDLKVFEGIDFMLSHARENMDRILRINHVYFTKSGFWNGLAACAVELQTAVLFGILGVLLMTGGITVGMFTMLYSACRQFGQTLNGMITAGNLAITDGILLHPMLEYLNQETEEENSADTKEVHRCLEQAGKGIMEWEFDNVTFRYPTASHNSMEACSFRIHSGETVALVGKNGAGKTTAVKLLCGFYQPQSGVIRLNGVDIRSIPMKEYRSLLAPTFQDFQLLPFRLDETILCHEAEGITDHERKSLERAAGSLGLGNWVKSLPHGFSTFLSQNLTGEGVLPSGGLAQKIALARSVIHGGGMVIMDEPTAALDPRSEEEIFQSMADISRDKTCLFISHRLSSTRLADRVLVMEDGRVAEEGSHEALMRQRGIYRELYEAQAGQYRDRSAE